MSRFRFQATDARGGPVAGEVKAFDRAGAEDQLAGRGLTVVALEPAVLVPRREASPLSVRDVTALLEQLQGLAAAGLPLPAGLRAAAAELEASPLRAALERLADHLDAGRPLDAALIAESNRFPAHLRGLVRAGARTGRLADVLAEVVHGSSLGAELRRRVGAALAYPALVLVVVMALTVFISHVAVRVVEGVNMGQGTGDRKTSVSVAAIFAIVRFVATYDGAIVLGLAAIAALGWAAWRFALAPATRWLLLERIPLIGPLLRFVSLAEFCHLAALLVEAETPLPEALDLAGASVRDPALGQACALVAAHVAAGQSFAAALRTWTTLPPGLGQLLAWGEDGSGLATSLRYAGDLLETRAEAQANHASQILGSLLLLLLFWWLGFAIATLYLPLNYAFQMLSAG